MQPLTFSSPASERRIHVLAETATEVVGAIGGWLFDQTSAGWDVAVLLASGGDDDHRCLRILGTRSLPMIVSPHHASAHTLVVAMTALSSDPTCQTAMHTAWCHGLRDVFVFGGSPQDARMIGLSPTRHSLSGAALAFKHHALRALGAPTATEDATEYFWRATSNIATVADIARREAVGGRQ